MALFGVLASPFDVDEWEAQTSLHPDMCMIFEHWDQQRDLDATFAKAKSLGYRDIFLTWEPWTPTATGVGNAAQGALQPEWSNESIAAGEHDAYISLMSKSIRNSGLRVFIRFAHEMNGDWHPWRTTPETYVKAWQRIVNKFKGGGTTNARFVWSPNTSLYQDGLNFLRNLIPYWPGRGYVDYIGLTMINFGGDKNYPMSAFNDRVKLMRMVFEKPLIASEVNCAYEIREAYFSQLYGWISQNNPFSLLNLSQPPVSRGQENGVSDGDMVWNVGEDPAILDWTRKIQDALHRSIPLV